MPHIIAVECNETVFIALPIELGPKVGHRKLYITATPDTKHAKKLVHFINSQVLLTTSFIKLDNLQ